MYVQAPYLYTTQALDANQSQANLALDEICGGRLP